MNQFSQIRWNPIFCVSLLLAVVSCQFEESKSKSLSKPIQTQSPKQIIHDDQKTLKQKVAEAKYVFDVRSQGEWDQGHLDHAFHVDYMELPGRIQEFVQDKNETIYVYCASGGRSGIAQQQLQKMGYKNVVNAGGYGQLK